MFSATVQFCKGRYTLWLWL